MTDPYFPDMTKLLIFSTVNLQTLDFIQSGDKGDKDKSDPLSIYLSHFLHP